MKTEHHRQIRRTSGSQCAPRFRTAETVQTTTPQRHHSRQRFQPFRLSTIRTNSTEQKTSRRSQNRLHNSFRREKEPPLTRSQGLVTHGLMRRWPSLVCRTDEPGFVASLVIGASVEREPLLSLHAAHSISCASSRHMSRQPLM